jgi:hypothetical protein
MVSIKRFIIICSIVFTSSFTFGQSYWFGTKLGGAMSFQSWGDGTSGGGVNRDPLFSLNGDIIIESYDEFKKGALYASLGYHTRGSSIQFFSFNNAFSDRQGYKFNNIVLELGAKRSLNLSKDFDPYFLIGIRGEYTINTNLKDFEFLNNPYTPNDVFVRKFNYGVTAGGGFEMEMSELSNVFFEFSIQPDLSYQYESPPARVTDPFQMNQTVDLPLRRVRNLSRELKVGVKFLRKVEYID